MKKRTTALDEYAMREKATHSEKDHAKTEQERYALWKNDKLTQAMNAETFRQLQSQHIFKDGQVET